MVRLSHTIALNALRCDFLHMMLTQEPYLIVRPGELFLLRARDEGGEPGEAARAVLHAR